MRQGGMSEHRGGGTHWKAKCAVYSLNTRAGPASGCLRACRDPCSVPSLPSRLTQMATAGKKEATTPPSPSSFGSPEARHLAAEGELDLARDTEARHLPDVRGRLGPGPYPTGGRFDSAYIDHVDLDQNVLYLRVDHSEVPEFHMTIALPLPKIHAAMHRQDFREQVYEATKEWGV